MKIALFVHSLISDWNHGNAHFLRGIASELISRGHELRIFEPKDAWSLQNLLRDHGPGAIQDFHLNYPQLHSTRYEISEFDIERALDGVSLALVHEWNSPELIQRIGRYRKKARSLRIFFHDTHHRIVTQPFEMARYEIDEYDGILAFGEVLAELYRRRGFHGRTWTWHEAADTRVFRPCEGAKDPESDLVWIGNWGDDERNQELREFLISPSSELHLRTEIYGVRYPEHALQELRGAGLRYRGRIANTAVPEQFSKARFTVHVPRRPYAVSLPGIPTIRVFEALACGIPLLSSPWLDSENLFRPGLDFIVAENGDKMREAMRAVLQDDSLAAELARNGLETIRSRHTCRHRIDELSKIHKSLGGAPL